MEKSSQSICNATRVKLRKENGLCITCGRRAAPGMARCAECGVAHRKAERKRKCFQPYIKTGVGRKPMYEGEEL